MKFYRITSCNYAHDLSGEGAFLYGGRWNSRGTRLLYTAESAALAMLEALAHVTMVGQQRAYCKLELAAANAAAENSLFYHKAWYQKINIEALPPEWRISPPPDALKQWGDAFASEAKWLALKVPSVMEPDSFNYLFNPLHPDFSLLTITQTVPVSFDQRLISK